jgi:hypothetical protein
MSPGFENDRVAVRHKTFGMFHGDWWTVAISGQTPDG